MNKIKEMVYSLAIPDQRVMLEKSREEILKIKKDMSDLMLNIKVAQYAYDSARLRELVSKVILTKDITLYPEINRLRAEIDRLIMEEDKIIEYKRLRYRLEEIKANQQDYFQTINIRLRNKLLDEELPNIYVYQGFMQNNHKKLYRNIIFPDVLTVAEEDDTLILPHYEFTSKRKKRHFYNRVSFQYLEQLSQDFEYDMESKNIPGTKVLVKK